MSEIPTIVNEADAWHLRDHPERTSEVRGGGGQPKVDELGQGEGGLRPKWTSFLPNVARMNH